jgi:hypothetical protein
MINYQSKYLKYKQKYYNLLKQNSLFGGFLNLKNDLKYKIDNAHFWGNQMSEHCLFLHLAIENGQLKDKFIDNSQLKSKLLDMHKNWENLLTKTFDKKGIDRNKIVLEDNDYVNLKLDKFEFDKFIKLTEELETIKKEIKERRLKGEWMGWIYVSFICHMLRELQYFKSKLVGKKFYPQLVIDFWNLTNAEHASLSGQLLDHDMQNDIEIKKANEFYQEFMKLSPEDPISFDPSKSQLLVLSIKKKDVLKRFFDESFEQTKNLFIFEKAAQSAINSNQVNNIIHPKLMDHEIRENERSIKELEIIDKILNKKIN